MAFDVDEFLATTKPKQQPGEFNIDEFLGGEAGAPAATVAAPTASASEVEALARQIAKRRAEHELPKAQPTNQFTMGQPSLLNAIGYTAADTVLGGGAPVIQALARATARRYGLAGAPQAESGRDVFGRGGLYNEEKLAALNEKAALGEYFPKAKLLTQAATFPVSPGGRVVGGAKTLPQLAKSLAAVTGLDAYLNAPPEAPPGSEQLPGESPAGTALANTALGGAVGSLMAPVAKGAGAVAQAVGGAASPVFRKWANSTLFRALTGGARLEAPKKVIAPESLQAAFETGEIKPGRTIQDINEGLRSKLNQLGQAKSDIIQQASAQGVAPTWADQEALANQLINEAQGYAANVGRNPKSRFFLREARKAAPHLFAPPAEIEPPEVALKAARDATLSTLRQNGYPEPLAQTMATKIHGPEPVIPPGPWPSAPAAPEGQPPSLTEAEAAKTRIQQGIDDAYRRLKVKPSTRDEMQYASMLRQNVEDVMAQQGPSKAPGPALAFLPYKEKYSLLADPADLAREGAVRAAKRHFISPMDIGGALLLGGGGGALGSIGGGEEGLKGGGAGSMGGLVLAHVLRTRGPSTAAAFAQYLANQAAESRAIGVAPAVAEEFTNYLNRKRQENQ
jgi:hypothetical protein